MARDHIINREKLERAEEARVAQASASTIPGMVSHVWNSAIYAEAMRQIAGRRKVR